MTLFYRSYLITFGFLLAAVSSLVLYLDSSGTISLHWFFEGLAAIGVVAGLVLTLVAAIGKPQTVERWADNASCHAEGTAYVALLALPIYGLLWCLSGDDRPPAGLPLAKVKQERARRRQQRSRR